MVLYDARDKDWMSGEQLPPENDVLTVFQGALEDLDSQRPRYLAKEVSQSDL